MSDDYKKLEEVQHQQLYDELFKILIEKSIESDPQLVASTFVALGFKLYRTELDDSDFKQVLETFVKKGKDIKPFAEILDKKRVH
jgi:hypothetical protein